MPRRTEAIAAALAAVVVGHAPAAYGQGPAPLEILQPTRDGVVGTARPGVVWRGSSQGEYFKLFVDGQDVFSGWMTCPYDPCDVHDVRRDLPDGPHTVQVRRYTGSGEQASTEVRAFTVAVPPAVRIATSATVAAGTGQPLTFDARGTVDNGEVRRFEWDFDGDGAFERDSGADGVEEAVYDQPGDKAVSVRATDDNGHSGTGTVRFHVALTPPDGVVGVSVNGGAQYTNDPLVVLHLVWPAGTRTVRMANDGGFSGSRLLPIAAAVPWRLDPSGSERLPKTVYVRFGDGAQNMTDDIILDQTPPRLLQITLGAGGRPHGAAGPRPYRLRLRAADGTSGVASLQVATAAARPSSSARARPSATARIRSGRSVVRLTRAPRWARVLDRAGNVSAWKRLRRR